MRWKDPIVKPPMNHNNPWQLFTVNQFGGGLVTSTSANQLESNQFTQFENLLYNPDGTVRSRMGRKPYGTTQDTAWLNVTAVDHAITNITDSATATITVTGDVTAYYGVGDIITIAGVTGADAAYYNIDYTITGVTYTTSTAITTSTDTSTAAAAATGALVTSATANPEISSCEAVSFFIDDVEGSEKNLIAIENNDTTAVEVRYENTSDYQTNIATLTTDTRPSFVKFAQGSAEEVIIANGVDAPLRWDGTTSTATELGLDTLDETFELTEITRNSPGVITIPGDVSDVFIVGSTLTVSNAEQDGSPETDYDGDYGVASISYTGGATDETTITTDVNTSAFGTSNATAGTVTRSDATLTQLTKAVGNVGVTRNGTYSYKFTNFYNETGTTKYGESNAGLLSTISVTGLNGSTEGSIIQIEDIGFAEGVEAVNIYRSRPDRTDVFYYVGRITSSGQIFKDTTETGAEGLPLPVDDGSVPKLLYPKNIDGRIVAVDGDIQNKLVWSPRSSPDQYPALNYIYFRDKIKGLAAFNGSTYVFTQDEIYSVPNSDFSAGIAVKICDKGAVSDRSIVDVGSGLVWLGDDTVYWANFNVQTSEGDFPVAVGRPVEDLIKGQAQAYKENACAAFFDRHYYLSFTTLGTSQNNLTLAMNTDIMQASLRAEGAGWIRMNWTARDIHRFEEKLYTLEKETTLTPQRFYLYEHEEDRYVDYKSAALYTAGTTSAIDINIRSGELHFGSPVVNKLVKGFSVSYYGDSAEYNVTLDANNGEYEESFNLSNEGISAAQQGSFLFWNTLDTNTGAWYGAPDTGWADIDTVTRGSNSVYTVGENLGTMDSGDEIWVKGVDPASYTLETVTKIEPTDSFTVTAIGRYPLPTTDSYDIYYADDGLSPGLVRVQLQSSEGDIRSVLTEYDAPFLVSGTGTTFDDVWTSRSSPSAFAGYSSSRTYIYGAQTAPETGPTTLNEGTFGGAYTLTVTGDFSSLLEDDTVTIANATNTNFNTTYTVYSSTHSGGTTTIVVKDDLSSAGTFSGTATVYETTPTTSEITVTGDVTSIYSADDVLRVINAGDTNYNGTYTVANVGYTSTSSIVTCDETVNTQAVWSGTAYIAPDDVSSAKQFNQKQTVVSAVWSGSATTITTALDSSGFSPPGTVTADETQLFYQYGTKISATESEQYYWATSQRGNNTIRKKCPTMKCSRLIYEVSGLDHRDARLGAFGIIYKVLPTAF
jgi:hypothetical protein